MLIGLRGATVIVVTALLSTVALTLALDRVAFPALDAPEARIALIAALLAAAAFGTGLPLIRLKRARREHPAENAMHKAEELSTSEALTGDQGVPFPELPATDRRRYSKSCARSKLPTANRLLAWGGTGLACLAGLVWMIIAGPGYMGYGASLLWTGAKRNVAPIYGITVKPGNHTVWRNSNQLITAEVNGIAPENAQLFVRFQSSAGWEPVAMRAAPDSSSSATYRFIFAGLSESVEYYITAGPFVSPHYKLRVVDLPSAKQISLTRH